MYSYGPRHLAELKQDDQIEHTYSSYVRIQDVALKTCQRRWTIGRSDKRGSGISVLAARHDDDDDDVKTERKGLILSCWIRLMSNCRCIIFQDMFSCQHLINDLRGFYRYSEVTESSLRFLDYFLAQRLFCCTHLFFNLYQVLSTWHEKWTKKKMRKRKLQLPGSINSRHYRTNGDEKIQKNKIRLPQKYQKTSRK